MEKNKGKLFVVSSPSGGGKSTICKQLLLKIPELEYSISTTTRQPRDNEKNGKDYYFISKDEFMKMIENDKFIEWAKVHGNYYGTSREVVDNYIDNGKNCILDIDIQGGKQIKEKYKKAVLIFIVPPSIQVLEDRLKKRATDS